MRYVLEVINRSEAKKRLPIIEMEIDYELLTLHDALLEKDKVQIIKTKERLKHLRKQLLMIQKETSKHE